MIIPRIFTESARIRHESRRNSGWLRRLLAGCLLPGACATSTDAAEYHLSPAHYSSGPYYHVSGNRTLTTANREREWVDQVLVYSGNMYKKRTTGGFTAPGNELVSTSLLPLPQSDYRILNVFYGGFRMPSTSAGDTLLYLGKVSGGRDTESIGLIWKSDNTTVTFSPIEGSSRMVPRDMNESMQVAGHIVKSVDRDGSPYLMNVPVRGTPQGTVSVIEPSLVDSYGYERIPRQGGGSVVSKDNHARAMAINSHGAIVCDMRGRIRGQSAETYFSRHWSFVSQNGSVTVEELPGGATDINDHGEVVGYNGGDRTWIYLPSGNYGLPAGTHVIDETSYDSTHFQSLQVLINNRGDVTWSGVRTTVSGATSMPPRLWRQGQVALISSLFESEQEIQIDDVKDLNDEGDLLLNTRFNQTVGETTFLALGNHILSLKPFQTEITVNVTGDEADADPNDGVIDTDLNTPGEQVTLRAAINAVNEGRVDTVKFEIPGGGVPIIILQNPLPEITRKMLIDGTTQPAGKVVVQGKSSILIGLHLSGGESEVKGMVLHGFSGKNAVALKLSGGGSNKVTGNWIGTDAAGNAAAGGSVAIQINGSPENQIGGVTAAEQNILYGEKRGIQISGAGADDNVIEGNRIGMAANGAILGGNLGVELSGGHRTKIGGPGARGNRFATVSGIAVSPESAAMEAPVIEGNRIGLNDAGTTTQEAGIGILVVGIDSAPVTAPRIKANLVAGNFIDIWLIGTTDAVVEGNQLGLQFNITVEVPGGQPAEAFQYGLRLDRTDRATISDNVIAGHVWDVAVSGTYQFYVVPGGTDDPDDDRLVVEDPDDYLEPDDTDLKGGHSEIRGNQIGIKGGRKPSGGFARTGIAVFSQAPNILIADNMVAGHGETEILLADGAGHVLRGNRVGTDDGTDYESLVGVLIGNTNNVSIGVPGGGNVFGRNALSGIAIVGKAVGTRIVENQIGVFGATEKWPNGAGIRIVPHSSDIQPDQTTIEDNVIGDNVVGIELNSAGMVSVRNNRIGVRIGGAAVSNLTGILISSTSATLVGNTIAYSVERGVHVQGDTTEFPVRIEGGSIFENGAGLSSGIYYDTIPFDPPTNVYALKSVNTGGGGTAVFAIPAAGVDGPVTYEIYGNPDSGAFPQGRTPLLRHTVNGMQPFSVKLDFNAGDAIAGLSIFRVIATYEGRSSEFSTHTAFSAFEWPEIDFAPDSVDGEIKIVWSGSDLFTLTESGDLSGFREVETEPTEVNGQFEVTVPMQDGSQFFRLELDTNRLFSQ